MMKSVTKDRLFNTLPANVIPLISLQKAIRAGHILAVGLTGRRSQLREIPAPVLRYLKELVCCEFRN